MYTITKHYTDYGLTTTPNMGADVEVMGPDDALIKVWNEYGEYFEHPITLNHRSFENEYGERDWDAIYEAMESELTEVLGYRHRIGDTALYLTVVTAEPLEAQRARLGTLADLGAIKETGKGVEA